MKIVVVFGTGLIASKAVAILRQRGHEVVAASTKGGVNTITGEGLKEALRILRRCEPCRRRSDRAVQ
jgi:glutamate dehydrogenase/leucine dehydrogenase